jgi:TPR repeat protein
MKQAAAWYLKAAEQGNAFAQHNLGVAYHDGVGVPQDYALAVLWTRKAAQQGFSPAQYNLGVAYNNGEGVPQDEAEAYFWLNLAATGEPDDSDKENAIKARDNAASQLTRTVLLQTQERARKWFEDHAARTPAQ